MFTSNSDQHRQRRFLGRRSFVGSLAALGASIVAGVVAIPALVSSISPAIQPRRRDIWRRVGRLQEYPIGAVQEGLIAADGRIWPRSLRNQAVFVWRPSETELAVLSRSCTDLGCPLEYDPGSTCFLCPCHGGIFAQNGARLAGPPSGPMYRYAHRIRDGMLEIDLSSVPPSV